MESLKLPKEVQQSLKTLIKEFDKKVGRERQKLEERLAGELKEELTKFCHANGVMLSDHFYADEPENFLCYYKDKESVIKVRNDQLEGATELFVNNAITEHSIGGDPSGDWDGYNRMEDMHEHAFMISGLDDVDFSTLLD